MEIYIITVEAERFAHAQPRRGEQAEERRVGLRAQPQRRAEPRGLAHDTLDLLVAVHVGRAPSVTVGQEPAGRHLGAWVGGAQPTGEPAHIIEAACACRRCGVGGCRRPAQRQLGRDYRCPLTVEKVDEAA
jgi:hypothetical protein